MKYKREIFVLAMKQINMERKIKIKKKQSFEGNARRDEELLSEIRSKGTWYGRRLGQSEKESSIISLEKELSKIKNRIEELDLEIARFNLMMRECIDALKNEENSAIKETRKTFK